jgi:hypothetical protein
MIDWAATPVAAAHDPLSVITRSIFTPERAYRLESHHADGWVPAMTIGRSEV